MAGTDARQELFSKADQRAWEAFYFHWHSGAKDALGPFFPRGPVPSCPWSVTLGWADPDPHIGRTLATVNRTVLGALRQCVPFGERLYAFDLHHWYGTFDPHHNAAATDPKTWPVHAFPNGDTYLFVAQELEGACRSTRKPPPFAPSARRGSRRWLRSAMGSTAHFCVRMGEALMYRW